VALAIPLARDRSTDVLFHTECRLKAKESWSCVLLGPADECDWAGIWEVLLAVWHGEK